MPRGYENTCRVRRWPGDPTVVQIVFYNQFRMPPPDVLAEWLGQLGGNGFTAVRTGALTRAQVAALDPLGFVEAQRLVLLEHSKPREAAERETVPRETAARDTVRTDRLAPAQHQVAGELDSRAFAAPWGIDAAAIADVCRATAHHRARAITIDGRVVAYAVSGRDGKLGFLQRLAVDPAAQRRGLGRALVADSLRWAARWRVERVLVNTHVENEAALALYDRMGFVQLADRLDVLEKILP
ncbi:MAG: GNAT family N-acetyltransferase [Ilumatobacteraceae bacterium]